MKEIKPYPYKREIAWTVISITILLLLVSILPFGKSICLKDEDSRVLIKIPIKQGYVFETEFFRSENQGRVVERYELDNADRSLRLLSAWYEEYDENILQRNEGEIKVYRENGMTRVDFPPNKADRIEYRSPDRSVHSFTYGTFRMELLQDRTNASVQISIDRLNMVEYLRFRFADREHRKQ